MQMVYTVTMSAWVVPSAPEDQSPPLPHSLFRWLWLLQLLQPILHQLDLLFLGELGIEECDLDAHAPGRCAGRMHGIAVEVQGEVDWLKPELHDSSRAAAKGHRPHASAGGV